MPTSDGRTRTFEAALWLDMLKVEGSDLVYTYMIETRAIVIPETIKAIRALTDLEADAKASMERTN
ncbi:MAG TPA: hypothetical protein VKY54_13065 [Kiloniellales bacterium]|nr:hypothetical protein [Kiloniellales bacterium]